MRRLSPEVWLSTAKRLPVGGTTRVPHRGDRTMRPNLVIGHDNGHYWAWCQSCQVGGKVVKEHCLTPGKPAPAASQRLDKPRDMVRVRDMLIEEQEGVAAFLARKSMDAMYLPELWFSEERKRILVPTPQGWMGRDSTENSPQKWLTYDRALHLDGGEAGNTAVVVEDTFSYYKVKYAVRGTGLVPLASLGTRLNDALLLRLMTFDKVVLFYDGDKAGYAGAERGAKRLRALGVRAEAKCAPEGLDPKDMFIRDIRRHLCLE